MAVTYDTGALVAADRGEHRMWTRHLSLLARQEVPTVPAPVLAQGWRGGARQARLAKLLGGCHIESLDEAQARVVGAMAARAQTTDIVDISVVEGALRRADLVISSDPDDLRSIADSIDRSLDVERP